MVLDSGAPPAMARLPMTPEEVAAAYDAAEGTTVVSVGDEVPTGTQGAAVVAGEAGEKDFP